MNRKKFVNVIEVFERIRKNDLPAEYWGKVTGLYEDIAADMERHGENTGGGFPVWAVFVAGYMMAERAMQEEKARAWRKGYRAGRYDEHATETGAPLPPHEVTIWKYEDGKLGDIAKNYTV